MVSTNLSGCITQPQAWQARLRAAFFAWGIGAIWKWPKTNPSDAYATRLALEGSKPKTAEFEDRICRADY